MRNWININLGINCRAIKTFKRLILDAIDGLNSGDAMDVEYEEIDG